MPVERVINQCDDCPFTWYDDYQNRYVCKEHEYDIIDTDPEHGRASWCPLDSGPVVIKAGKR